ncbi:hypothetical protein F2P79_011702 [Pimephales promelas]|nr:hypothetical protein F2P79_011702 [Pimephales promelas]
MFVFLPKTTDHMRFCTFQRTWIGVLRSTAGTKGPVFPFNREICKRRQETWKKHKPVAVSQAPPDYTAEVQLK